MKGHFIMYSRFVRMLTVVFFSAVLLISPFSVLVTDSKATSSPVISINNGASLANSRMVVLSLNYPGAVSMQFSIDNVTWGSWKVFTATTSYPLTSGDGVRTIYVRFKDSGANISSSYSDDIILDATKPTGTIAVNKGEAATNTAAVLVTLSPSDADGSGVTSYCLSNSAVSTCSKWVSYKADGPRVSWTLAGAKTDGVKTVYALFKDAAGNISNSIQDTIILDTAKPKDGTCTITSTDNNALVIEWTAAVDASPIDTYKLYYSTKSSPQCLGIPLARFLGSAHSYTHEGLSAAKTHYYRICALDSANHLSSGATAKGTPIDTAGPTNARVIINGGAAYANKTAVALRLIARDDSGISKVCVSNTDTCTNWQAYAADKTFNLTSGQGLKTVYARFKDGVGNVSEPVSSTISLDTAKPVGQVVINNNDSKTKILKVTLQLSATDDNSVSSMQFSNNGSSWSNWVTYATSKEWNLAAGADGTRTVYARFKDAAGNLSNVVKDTIALNTKTPPELSITTAPFTTSMNTVEISGTKESQSTISIKLNGTSLDGSLITQVLADKTWTAQVGPFTEGDNLISVTATDPLSHKTVKTLAVVYEPFASAYLAGDWLFTGSGFDLAKTSSWTGHGNLHFDADELALSDPLVEIPFTGDYLRGSESKDITGNLTFDGDGVISGQVLWGGETLTITNGKMDENRSMLTLVTDHEMLTAVKKGSAFTQAYLTGQWFVLGVAVDSDNYSAGGGGSLTCDATGKITYGAVTYNFYAAATANVLTRLTGALHMAANGGVSGTMNESFQSGSTSVPYTGQMSAGKNVITLCSPGTNEPDGTGNQLILIKSGGTFDSGSLDGQWRLEGVYDDLRDGVAHSGYLSIADGKIVAGTLNEQALVLADSKLLIDTFGVVRGTLKTSDRQKYTITFGKIDANKKTMALIAGAHLFIGYAER